MSVNKHRAAMSRQASRAVFDMNDLVSATQALLRSTASYTGAEIEEARAKLARQLESIQDDAGQWNQRARTQCRELIDTTDEYVRENPWSMVGVAAMVGIITGLCVSGRCRK
ncbi:DUF883 family protein [Alcaligenaceae bacterium CGII-47]|nr:DUF883 family protein [Alcaligenaceae bacterium CGII-47]